MSVEALEILIEGRRMGRLERSARGRLAVVYDEEWRRSGGPPLSLSMPTVVERHDGDVVDAFLWGLLPDDPTVIDRWAKRFQVSAREVFGLIQNVGEDCAGAVQFVRPERLEALASSTMDSVEWLDDAGVEVRLALVRADASAVRMGREGGQFSLAGAQPKTALLLYRGTWGVPVGAIPTTHILKPPTTDLQGHAENEHFCLSLAREMKIVAARSWVGTFGAQGAIVVERFDRRIAAMEPIGGHAGGQAPRYFERIHQEDFCQALGLPPTSKYQAEGGPSPADIANLLRDHSDRPAVDVQRFALALIFNWIIGGTDAHAKNYSVLFDERGKVRLAPLYDVASAFPYPQLDQGRLKLAMKLGGTHRVREIGKGHVLSLARELGLRPDDLVRSSYELAIGIRDRVTGLAKRERAKGLGHPIVSQLATAIEVSAGRCATSLSGPAGAS